MNTEEREELFNSIAKNLKEGFYDKELVLDIVESLFEHKKITEIQYNESKEYVEKLANLISMEKMMGVDMVNSDKDII